MTIGEKIYEYRIAKNLSPSGISEREVINMMKKRRNGDDKND